MAIDFTMLFAPSDPDLAALRSGLEVDFWPGTDRDDAKFKLAVERRAAVLFDGEDVADNVYCPPMVKEVDEDYQDDAYGNVKPDRPKPNAPFILKPSYFLKKARQFAPERAQPTASGLAQWVYSLYSSAKGDDEDKERGKRLEQEVFDRRLLAAGSIDNAYLKETKSLWRLVHNGLHIRNNQDINYYRVPSLLIGGKPMRVSPDLVYRNRETGEIFIVEIKNTRMNVPSNLWPNVWAQLWVYAQIPEVLDAPKVTAVGEVWGERFSWTQRIVSMRACVKRDPRQPQFDRFFRQLFEIYSKGALSP